MKRTVKTSKKLISLLLVFTMLSAMTPATTFAEEFANYEHNLSVVSDVELNPKNFIDKFGNGKEDTYIVNLSNEIVSGISGDYEKVQAIYQWVVENISYDFAAYNEPLGATIITEEDEARFAEEGFAGEAFTARSDVTTAVLRRGVCEDYAVLLENLLNVQGIPCFTVSGYLVTDPAPENLTYDKLHAWNCVYVNGEWSYFDATINSPAVGKDCAGLSLEEISYNHYFTEDGFVKATSTKRYSISKQIEIPGGSIDVSPMQAEVGSTVTVTISPDAGYKLSALQISGSKGNINFNRTTNSFNEYTFIMPDDFVTVGAEFVPGISADENSLFADVPTGSWFYGAVKYVYENELMNGASDTLFSPNDTTTRGMIVTILHRMENQPSAKAAAFKDVQSDAYYSDAVAWAAANGIVKGYTDTQFAPNDEITREQMAAILYRYAEYKKYSINASADISIFADDSQVSDYALDAIKWANSVGLINGRTANTLAPQGDSTRVEVATMIQRFAENIK